MSVTHTATNQPWTSTTSPAFTSSRSLSDMLFRRGFAKKGKKKSAPADENSGAAAQEADSGDGDGAEGGAVDADHFDVDGMFDDEAFYGYVRERMDVTVSFYADELSSLQTGRASPAMLERLSVDAYETRMSLQELATVTVLNTSTLSVTPYDSSVAESIEKAIRTAALGLNPVSEAGGTTITVPVPPPSAESKEAMRKHVTKSGEATKVKIRAVRQRALNIAKASKSLTESERKVVSKEVQTITDNFVSQVGDMSKAKEADL